MFPLYGLLFAFLPLPLPAAAQTGLPIITLPWGKWQASTLESSGSFYVWQNIRFGKAPVGDLRFRASVSPDPTLTPVALQNSSYGPTCFQVDTTAPCTPGGRHTNGLPPLNGDFDEDCLFLDLYVPQAVFERKTAPAPVVAWIYGGGYVYGGKSTFGPHIPFYNGTGLLESAFIADQNVIYVAGNYRVGAFGWLAGSTMEVHGTPNAGLYDQRLLLQWVQDYISLVNGDNTQVSAWGESAGAGSIIHHLIANNGTTDPLFSKALVLSPAFSWQWNRTGTLEEVFLNYTKLAGCQSGNITCLRLKDATILDNANQLLFQEGTKCTGIFDVGPSLDGRLFTQLPAVAFATQNYWKNLSSFIISHVADESSNFVPPYIKTWEDFAAFIARIYTGSKFTSIRNEIHKRYYDNVCSHYTGYDSPPVCLSYLIRDAFFVCNTRQIYDAYSSVNTSMYMMQYYFLNSFGGAKHADDLIATFWNQNWNLTDFLRKYGDLSGIELKVAVKELSELAPPYQSYFMSHAVSGDPNKCANDKTVAWPPAYVDSKGFLQNVLNVRWGTWKDFALTYDAQNSAEACGFWNMIAQNVTQIIEHEAMVQVGERFVVQRDF